VLAAFKRLANDRNFRKIWDGMFSCCLNGLLMAYNLFLFRRDCWSHFGGMDNPNTHLGFAFWLCTVTCGLDFICFLVHCMLASPPPEEAKSAPLMIDQYSNDTAAEDRTKSEWP